MSASVEDKLKQIGNFSEATIIGPLWTPTGKKSLKHPHILVDGGADFQTYLSQDKDIPLFSVGDGDSAHSPMDIKLNPDKDYSDLKYALGLIPNSIVKIHLLGFLGKRKDHEILNLGEVFHFLKKRPHKTLVNIGNSFLAFNQGAVDLNINGVFSIITFERTCVKITGNCKYQLEKMTNITPFTSFGLSNLGHGKIRIETSGVVFIYTRDNDN